jgi:cyanate permease
MNAKSLPVRIVYAVAALPLGGATGFYSIMFLLPKLVGKYPKLDAGMSGQEMFNLAVSVGAAIGFMAAIFALTLPWIRHRKRRDRPWRIAASFVIVLVASVGFADLVPRLILDLLFAAWLAYTMAYTFVRYGVIDEPRRVSARYY